MFLVAFLVYSAESDKQLLSLKESEANTVNLSLKTLENELYQAITDLRYLSRSARNKTIAQLTQEFTNFSQEKKIYDQVRFISPDGQEQVRVNFRYGSLNVIAPQDLQNKKDRYYFRDSISLSGGEIFVSPLDLNVEHGAIEKPFRPVIRLGMAVRSMDGEKRGVVILNYLAQNMLKRFRQYAGDVSGNLRLVNSDGYWLSHENAKEEYSFMWQGEKHIQQESAEDWKRIKQNETGQFVSPNGLYSFATVRPITIGKAGFDKDYYWKIVAHTPLTILQDKEDRRRFIILMTVAPLYIGVIILCIWLAYSRVKRKESQTELAVSEAKNRSVIEASLEVIVTTNIRGIIQSWNPAAEALFGYSEKEALGQSVEELIIPEEYRPKHREAMYGFSKSRRTGLLGDRVERPALRKDGQIIPIDIAVTAQRVKGDLYLTAFIRDLRERKLNEERDRLIKAVFNETQDAITICDHDNNIVMVNKAYTDLTGFELEDVMGQEATKIASKDRYDRTFFAEIWGHILMKGSWKGEIWVRDKEGSEFPTRSAISTVRDSDGGIQNFITIFNDITEEKEAAAIIERQAHYDALTELPNRFLFQDRLERAVVESSRYEEKFALLFIDLDKFKPINDTYGHQAGDDVLKEVARRLMDGARESDTIARLAGDEFTMIARHLNSRDEVSLIVNKMKTALCGPFEYEGHIIEISGSIGYALFPDDGDTTTAILDAADKVMYSIKKQL